MTRKKNCFTCIHLEIETDCGECGTKEYSWYECAKPRNEDIQIRDEKLGNSEYLKRYKRCYEPKIGC